MKNKYKFWKNRYDLSEINKSNWREVLQDYFFISIRSVSLLGVLLALEIVTILFSKFILGLFPIGTSFLVLELSLFVVIIVLFSFNLFYALMFNFMSVILRLIMFGSEPVGLLSMFLVDGFFLVVCGLIIFLIKKFLVIKYERCNEVYKQKSPLFWLIAMIIAVFSAAAFAVLINYAFIFKLYGVAIETYQINLLISFLFTTLKLFLNGIIFMLIFKSVYRFTYNF